eukprot:scaffold106817_cov51-Attheya_sp.AAC.2
MQNRMNSDDSSNEGETKQSTFSRGLLKNKNAVIYLVLALSIWSIISTDKRNIQQWASMPMYFGAITASTKTMGNDIPVNANENKTIYFSQARKDRSGSFIQDILMCHAYSFLHNVTYGGVCFPPEQYIREEHLPLMKSVGLQDIFPFSCPNVTAFPNSKIIPDSIYRRNGEQYFTRNYLDFIQHQVHGYSSLSNSSKPSIGVHIRRGDVFLCSNDVKRYLPNSHYLSLIEKYSSGDGNHVTIYSESQYHKRRYFESFKEFSGRGYDLVLDGDIADVWKGLMSSDVVILSKSSFSFVPALLAKGKVVFTPFWHAPLPSWDIVDDVLLNETKAELQRLRTKFCTSSSSSSSSTDDYNSE